VTRAQKITIIVMMAGSFLSVLNQTQMNPALPAIMTELNVSANTAQWLVSGFTLVNAITVALSAFLMDRFRNKRLFIAAFSLFLIGSLLAAWGITFPVLLAGRFLQAICAGIMIPMAMTTLLLLFPLDQRGFAMGLYTFVIMFAPAIGPAVSGVLTDSVGWHVTFLIMAALAALIILGAIFFMEEFSTPKDVNLDIASVILCAVGLFALLYGISVIGDELPVGAALLAVGAVMLVFFSRRQLQMTKPFLQIGVLRATQFRIGAIVLMLMSMSLTAAAITLPLYVQQVRGMSATTSGMIMMPGAILGAISGFFAGRLSDRIGTRPLAIIGVFLTILGSVGMAFWGLTTPVAVLILIYSLRYIGLMLTNTPINLWSISTLSNETLNHGNAVSNTLRQVASTFGTALMITVMSLVTAMFASRATTDDGVGAQLTGIHATFYLSSLIALAAMVLVLRFVRNKTITTTPVELDEELIELELTEL